MSDALEGMEPMPILGAEDAVPDEPDEEPVTDPGDDFPEDDGE
jgi:hypothetical protein